MDRIQVLKQEWSALGGDAGDEVDYGAVPIQPQEDALEAAGLYVQSATARDTSVLLSRDASGNMTFKDAAVTGGKTLSQLLGLQNAYSNGSAGPQVIQLDSTRLGVVVRDYASSTTSPVFAVQKSDATPFLHVKYDGTVGVGTDVPEKALHVKGASTTTIRVDYAATVKVDLVAASGGASVGTYSNHQFALATNNTDRVKIDTSGNVGIGCTPSDHLHVLSTTNTKGITLETATDNAYLTLKCTATSGTYWNLASCGGSSGWGAGNFALVEANANARVTIKPGGKVGISTSSPGEVLSVAGHITLGASNWVKFGDATSSANVCGVGHVNGQGLYMAVYESGAGGTLGTDSVDAIRILQSSGYVCHSPMKSNCITIYSDEIWNRNNASDAASLYLNFRGYNDGYTYYRDLHICNGKSSDMAFFDGSTGQSRFYNAANNSVAYVYNSFTGGTLNANLIVGVTYQAAGTGYNLMRLFANDGTDPKFTFRGDGNGYCDGSWSGGGADYAESVEPVLDPGAYEEGDVLVIADGDRYDRSAAAADPRVAGVISVKPAVLAGAGPEPIDYESGTAETAKWKVEKNKDEALTTIRIEGDARARYAAGSWCRVYRMGAQVAAVAYEADKDRTHVMLATALVKDHDSDTQTLYHGVTELRRVKMAMLGRVRVKCVTEGGNIRPGDLLVTSLTPGHAMRAPENPARGTVLGKALGVLEAAGPGTAAGLVMVLLNPT